jgi:hypothetical protein
MSLGIGDVKSNKRLSLPPTDIQRPLAKAVSASETTKLGKIDDINTTRDSAATRSRNSHMIHVKKACAVG